MLNKIVELERVKNVAHKQNVDKVWNEIFDSLVLDNEPPIEYIKNATIVTKTGVSFKVNAIDFAQILEREKYITPEESEILSCRLAINFDKVRRDVDQWATTLIAQFDNQGAKQKTKTRPRTRKVAAKTKKEPVKATAKTTTKRSTKKR